MNGYRTWFRVVLIIIMLPLLAIAGFNFFIDPLWNFSHSHAYNRIQQSFNERQQKTNQVTFGPFDSDGLLLGSSRCTYINQNDFTNMKVYNYAVSAMTLDEYDGYINYARQQHGREFDTIYLGLDFYATNRNLKRSFEEPAYYIQTANDFGYRYKTLLSLDTLHYSLENYRDSKAGIARDFTYDRKNVKTLNEVPDAVREAKIKESIKTDRRHLTENYSYHDVRKILMEIKAHNPHTRFVVFTTPVAEPIYEVMVSEGLWPYYRQWLSDIVDVFGEVYHFNSLNSITRDTRNFYDGSHVYPKVNTLLVHRLIGQADPRLPDDFGILLNRQNLDDYFENQ